jgi:hypothetical protein
MTDTRKKVSRVGMVIILLLIVGYALFESHRYLEGPVITITAPSEGQAVMQQQVRVTGTGQNLSYFYINDSQAYLNEDGTFSYLYTPPAGYTTLTALGRDRFGRSVRVVVHFNVKN